MRRTRTSIVFETLPAAVRAQVGDVSLYDSSCSPEARVLFVDRGEGLFLKIAPAGALASEAAMTEFFHARGLSAELLLHCSEAGSDYLITRRIPGEDCTHERYLTDPERLCDTYAELLRELHDTDPAGCPIVRTATYTQAVREGIARGSYEEGLFRGLWDFGSADEVVRAAEEGISLLKTEALIHGDYCLPNTILDDWRFSGFIDVGNGGIADQHIDILWGIWTLKYNLGTAMYTERFMDAYGRDAIEPDKLRCIAAMEMVAG